MKIIDILLPEEIETAQKSAIKILDNPLKNTTVSELRSLYACIVFKVHDPESDGHPAAHVLNELHLRAVTMDYYPQATSIDEAIALRRNRGLQ